MFPLVIQGITGHVTVTEPFQCEEQEASQQRHLESNHSIMPLKYTESESKCFIEMI